MHSQSALPEPVEGRRRGSGPGSRGLQPASEPLGAARLLRLAAVLALLLSWSCTKDSENETSTMENIFSCFGATADLFHDEIIGDVYVVSDGVRVRVPGPLDVKSAEFLERDEEGNLTGTKVVEVTIAFWRDLVPGSISAEDDLEVRFGNISNLQTVDQSKREFTFSFDLGSTVAAPVPGIECPTSRVEVLLKKRGNGSPVEVITQTDEAGNPTATRGLDSDYLILYDFIRGVGINPQILQINCEGAKGQTTVLAARSAEGDPVPLITRLDPSVERVKPHTECVVIFANEMMRVDHQVTPSGRVNVGALSSFAPMVFEWGSTGDEGLAVNQTYMSVFWSSLMGLPPEGHLGTLDRCGLKLAPDSYVVTFLTAGVRIEQIVGRDVNGVEKPFGPPLASDMSNFCDLKGPFMEDVGAKWTIRGARSLGSADVFSPTPAVRKVKARIYPFEKADDLRCFQVADSPEATNETVIPGSDGDPDEVPEFGVNVSLGADVKPGKKLVQVEGFTAGGKSLGLDEVVVEWRPPIRFLSFRADGLPADGSAVPAKRTIGVGDEDPTPEKDASGKIRPAVFVSGFKDEFTLAWKVNDGETAELCGGPGPGGCESVKLEDSRPRSYQPVSVGPNPSELAYTRALNRQNAYVPTGASLFQTPPLRRVHRA